MKPVDKPMRMRFLIECSRQWARWHAGMDDIEVASDAFVIDVVDGAKAVWSGNELKKLRSEGVEPASREDWNLAVADNKGPYSEFSPFPK